MRKILSYTIVDSNGDLVRKGSTPFKRRVCSDKLERFRTEIKRRRGWDLIQLHYYSCDWDSVLNEFKRLRFQILSVKTDYKKRVNRATGAFIDRYNEDKLRAEIMLEEAVNYNVNVLDVVARLRKYGFEV